MPNFKKLFVPEDFFNNLSVTEDGYTIQDWFQDKQVKAQHKSFLRSFKGLHCETICSTSFQDAINENECSEVFLLDAENQRHPFFGGIIAHSNSYPLTSMLCHPHWKQTLLAGEKDYLDEQSDEICSCELQFDNIHEEDQLLHMANQYEEEIFEQISSGQDLWEKRERLFSNIIFCDSVKADLYSIPSKGHIDNVIKKLRILDKYLEDYHGSFSHEELKLGSRPESSSVQKDSKLKNMRRFKLPNGSYEYFMDHMNVTTSFVGRIHFFMDNAEGKCYIGYIGKHLPTKKF